MILKAIKKLEIAAAAANGAMPTFQAADDVRSYLLSESVNFNIAKPTLQNAFIDGYDAPFVSVPGRSEGGTIEFKLTQLSGALLAKFFGGTATGDSWSKPAARSKIDLGVKITGETANGKAIEISIPLCVSATGIMGNPSYDNAGLASLDVTLVIQQPVDGTGAAVSPWSVKDALAE